MYATRRDTLAAGEPGPPRKQRIATFGTISALAGILIGIVGVPGAKASTADTQPATAGNAQFERTAGTGLGVIAGAIGCAITRNPGTCTADGGAWLVFFSRIENWHSYPYIGPSQDNQPFSGRSGTNGAMR